MTMPENSPYMTVPEVAAELGMTADGVYKLIKRGKLPALKLSERGVRVTSWALEAYRERLAGGSPASLSPENLDHERLEADFVQETGMSPADWIAAWKKDEGEDTAADATILVRALALVTVTDEAAAGDASWPAAVLAAV